MRLLRTNSANETFELRKLEFQTHLLERCLLEVYSRFTRELAENILAEVKFSSRNEALLKTKQKHPEILCLSSRHWHLITESNRLGQIYSEPAIVAYMKDKSL